MKRRNFIGLATLAASGVAASGYISFEKFEMLMRKIIIKDTASLKVDLQEIDKFFADTSKYKVWNNLFPFANQQVIRWHYYVDNPLFSLPYSSNYKLYRSKIVGLFLLSSDFFVNKMDVNKPITYRSLYDPYISPCSNPFSNLFYPGV